MAGYHNYSKSNNAIAAERAGRYPASKCAQLLGVPIVWVQRQRTTEWHHTSARYNMTDYYELDALQEHLETPEGQEQLAEVKAELAALKQAPERVWTGVEVRWVVERDKGLPESKRAHGDRMHRDGCWRQVRCGDIAKWQHVS
jgi:hypothetical protein